jgi:hypothetical protein
MIPEMAKLKIEELAREELIVLIHEMAKSAINKLLREQLRLFYSA